SSGQVAPPAASTGMTRFAAARAADQVSFGATPVLVNAISQQGLDAWIGTQFSMPVTRMAAPSYVKNYDANNTDQTVRAYSWVPNEFFNLALTAPDQLRLRVSWALLQFIPVNGKVPPYGQAEYFNLLQEH